MGVTSENITENVDEFNSEFVSQMLEYWDNNLTNIFHRQKDILVADSVLELFRKRAHIENFNKKALYILIRRILLSRSYKRSKLILCVYVRLGGNIALIMSKTL